MASPYGLPYGENGRGSGWEVQSFGAAQYFFYRTFPKLFPADYFQNAVNFILGVHPGSNTSSYVSGVGVNSAEVAYGINRADWSYIPGGVIRGTAIIQPDFPELKNWPFLWQQVEYVMGGGATNFMFIVLATKQTLEAQ